MTEVEVVVRKWGNSVGVTFPKKVAEENSIKIGKKIRVEIKGELKRMKPGAFGCLKGLKIDPQKMKDQLRKEHEW